MPVLRRPVEPAINAGQSLKVGVEMCYL
jgi:hypothetical protein